MTWGGRVKTSEFGQFIEQAASLPLRQREALAAQLNCGLQHEHGLQRYRCVVCARSFNGLTGTPLARLRHRGKWLPYLECMLQSDTVRRAATLVGIHKNTRFRWRHRFLSNTKHDRAVPLGGITEADETYLLESQKGSRHLDRAPRRRGGRASRRGLSHEYDCILVARDRTGRTVDFVTGRAPLNYPRLNGDIAICNALRRSRLLYNAAREKTMLCTTRLAGTP
jgi:hypothetical protein